MITQAAVDALFLVIDALFLVIGAFCYWLGGRPYR